MTKLKKSDKAKQNSNCVKKKSNLNCDKTEKLSVTRIGNKSKN